MANNSTMFTSNVAQKSLVQDLNSVTQNFVIYLPLIFVIFGFIGFIGNLFTYLQSELRSNTCCIYSLCGSIVDIINLFVNLFPTYLGSKYGIHIPWYTSSFLCKLNLFLLVFLPHLPINFLFMAIIDRFASTCSLTSPLRRLNQLKMTPLMISITIITSCLVSLYAPILYDLTSESLCLPTQPTTTSILYITLIGLMQPISMLIFVLLTYRNVHQSRQRVGGTTGLNRRQSRIQFILMIFVQIILTAFFSLQWIIMYTYFTITANEEKSADQWSIIFFVFSLSNYCFYLNYVKSFYVSIMVSRLFRKTFIKGIINLLPRRMHPQLEITMTMISTRPQGTLRQKVMSTKV